MINLYNLIKVDSVLDKEPYITMQNWSPQFQLDEAIAYILQHTPFTSFENLKNYFYETSHLPTAKIRFVINSAFSKYGFPIAVAHNFDDEPYDEAIATIYVHRHNWRDTIYLPEFNTKLKYFKM